MEFAHFAGAFLESASFKEAHLSEAFLIGTIFRYANLEKADLGNAFLIEANLEEANLKGADLEYANLKKADLRGAKNLTVDQFSKAKTLNKAQLDQELEAELRAKGFGYLLDDDEPEDDEL